MTLAQFAERAMSERLTNMLTKPRAKWTDAEAKSEPEIYAWLKEKDDEILPWEWTEEARRKDPNGYVKCWRHIWKERKSFHEERLAQQQKELKRLDREIESLTTVQVHRTNQIARLRAVVATNDFPCEVALEHLEKGRFWGWNTKVEIVECKEASALDSLISNSLAREAQSCQALIDRAKEERAEANMAYQGVEALRKQASVCADILDSKTIDEKEIRNLKTELSKNLKGRSNEK